MKILVLNSGSSSIKFELIDTESNARLAEGSVERIGEKNATLTFTTRQGNQAPTTQRLENQHAISDHLIGLQRSLGLLIESGIIQKISELDGIGHRIVHGGELFCAPVIVDDEALEKIRGLSRLAPLHNPAGVAGIEVGRQLAPEVPQVAVFDTAFHHSLPPEAYCYALPRELTDAHGLRRYGFHGTSHRYICRATAKQLDSAENQLNLITLHLGNGCSAAAIRNGKSVDTSMGFTPLEGLVMGTRCGDIDPAICLFLIEQAGYTAEQVDELLNRASGLKGLCGVNDMREVLKLSQAGNNEAELALKIFCYRIRKYIGAYMAVLGRVDALVFTAGIGEYSPDIRRRCCSGLEPLGIEIDEQLNKQAIGIRSEIQSAQSRLKVLVIPTDEELEIAYASRDCLSK